jgi:hypothetical protein
MRHLNWSSRCAPWTGALLLALVSLATDSTRAAPATSLVSPQVLPPGRVKVVFEVDGHLLPESNSQERANDKDSSAPPPVELKAKGDFIYEERIAHERRGRALRYYEQAEAELAIGRQPRQSSLREDRRFVAVDTEVMAGESGFRSLQGPLTREELELIELPGSSHLVNQLLPGRPVKVNETWTHDDSLLAQLLSLTGVTVNEVTSQFKGIDEDRQVALVTLNGKVLGYAAGVVTEIELEGKYNIDLQLQRVTWLALGIHEERATGPTKPGLNVQARVRMLIEPLATPPNLSPESLRAVTANVSEPTPLLEYQPSHGRFTLLHNRHWHVFGEQPELTILRLIDDGQLIAQCNLRSLSARQPSHAMSLSHFQKEIRTALGSAAKQIVDADETVQPSGVRELRVSIVGEVATAPVHWVYYQLADADGQVVTCVFTMSGQSVERFGSEDVSLVNSLTLNPPARSATPPADNEEPSGDVARRSDDPLQ